MRKVRALFIACSACFPLLAQQPVDSGLTYHHVWAVTPIIGSGTPADPRRPLFVPAQPAAASDRTGVLAYGMQLSDDGNFALVEFVFQSPAAFQNILAKQAAAMALNVAAAAPGRGPSALQTALQAAIPGLQIFERGKATQSDILAEFQKHKKSFSFANSHPVIVP
jgi:hypothetical protein